MVGVVVVCGAGVLDGEEPNRKLKIEYINREEMRTLSYAQELLFVGTPLLQEGMGVSKKNAKF